MMVLAPMVMVPKNLKRVGLKKMAQVEIVTALTAQSVPTKLVNDIETELNF